MGSRLHTYLKTLGSRKSRTVCLVSDRKLNVSDLILVSVVLVSFYKARVKL